MKSTKFQSVHLIQPLIHKIKIYDTSQFMLPRLFKFRKYFEDNFYQANAQVFFQCYLKYK